MAVILDEIHFEIVMMDAEKHPFTWLLFLDRNTVLIRSSSGFDSREECVNGIKVFQKSVDAPLGTIYANVDRHTVAEADIY